MERWADVGPLLQAARADMKVGQLLSGEAFSLFEAMSALEAGNPKMDAAASPSAERPTLKMLLDDPAVAPWDLPAATLLDVLDQLLAMEASWHCGGSAMQTVYACLYMLKLDRAREHDSPSSRALYAYCRALQCDCAAVRDLVISGGVCEEEDINVFSAGIPFEPPEGAAAAALAALDAAVAEAERPGPATAAGGANDLGPAVALRLRLRRAIHSGLQQAASHDPKEVSAALSYFAEAGQLLARMRESTAAAAPSAAAAATPAAAPSGSVAVEAEAAPPPPPLLAPGFQVDVNRHLLGPAPPRQVQVMSYTDALSYMERMVEHMQIAVAIPDHVHDYRSLQLYLWRFARMRPGAVARSMLHALILPDRWQDASAAGNKAPGADDVAQTPQPGEVAGRGGGRKGSDGRKGGQQRPAAAAAAAPGGTSTSSHTTPAWVPSKEMIAAACQVSYKAGIPEEAELFFDQAVIAVSNVCQAIMMNRCRSRRRLRRCLDDWLNMYHHGYNADVVPAFKDYLKATGWRWRPLDGQPPEEDQGPLSTWVECQTCGTMMHHLLLGFELELYEPLEYDMIYWYCDYLCTCMVAAFTAILQRCPPPQPPQPPLPQGLVGPGGRGLGHGRGAAGPAKDPAAAAAALMRYEREQLQLRYEVLEVEAMQQLCQGMLRIMAGLRLAGAVPEPKDALPFNTGAQRFEQRFSAFSPLLRPPPLGFEDYQMSMDPGGRDASYLLTLACSSFKEARVRCANLKSFAPTPDVAAGWVRGLERVAAMNAVVSGVLIAKLGSEGKVKWDCDWAAHPYFPAVSLPRAAPAAAPPAAAPAPSSGAPLSAGSQSSDSACSASTSAP